MEVGAIAPPPKFAAKINEDYTTPPNFANVKFIKNPRNLNLKDSEKTIVKSEDSPIDVMTKLGTCLSENLNKEAKIQLSTSTSEASTRRSENADVNALDSVTNRPPLPKPPPLPPSDASAKDKTKLSDNSDANAKKATTQTQPTTEHFLMKVEPKMQTDATSWHCNPTNRPMLVQVSVTAKRELTSNANASAKIQDMQVNNPCKIWQGTELPSE